jgi:hypothetical protein
MRKLVIVCITVLAFGALISQCKTVGDEDKRSNVKAERPFRRVTLGPTRLRYFEGENVLSLAAEMGSDRTGSYYVVYVPTPSRWLGKMPEWCRERRDEIMTEILRLTNHERIKWRDET